MADTEESPAVKDLGVIADESKQKTLFGKLRAEIFNAGYAVYHLFDADGKNHWPIFIFSVSFVEIVLFFLMLCLDHANSTALQLSCDIKLKFGALDAKLIASYPLQFWRIFSSVFLHASVLHLVNNLAAQIMIGWTLERKYGFLVTAFIYIVSGIGGNLFSLIFESLEFEIVVGASGCAFGLLGSYISDWIKNRESIRLPILRAGFVIICIVLLFVQGYFDPSGSISNFSHVGGLYTGIFPILNILPNLKEEKWEVILLYTGVLSAIMEFIGLPIIFFCAIAPPIASSTISLTSC